METKDITKLEFEPVIKENIISEFRPKLSVLWVLAYRRPPLFSQDLEVLRISITRYHLQVGHNIVLFHLLACLHNGQGIEKIKWYNRLSCLTLNG